MSYIGLGQTSSITIGIGTPATYYTLFPDGNSALKAGYGSFYNDPSGQLSITGPYGPLKVFDPANVNSNFKGPGYLYSQGGVLYVGGPAGPITVNQKNLAPLPAPAPPPPPPPSPPPPSPSPVTNQSQPIINALAQDVQAISATQTTGASPSPSQALPSDSAYAPAESSGSGLILIILAVAGIALFILLLKKKRKAPEFYPYPYPMPPRQNRRKRHRK
jgi:hypothetical protein